MNADPARAAPCASFVCRPAVCEVCGRAAAEHAPDPSVGHLLSRAEARRGAKVLSAEELGRAVLGDRSALTASLVHVENRHTGGRVSRWWRVVLAVEGPRHLRSVQLRPRELRQTIAWLVAGAARIPAEAWAAVREAP